MKRDEPMLVHGEVRMNTRDEENPRAEITAIDIELLSRVRTQKTTEVALRIDADRLAPRARAGAEDAARAAHRRTAP